MARRQWSGGLPYADLLQVGRIGLWHALEHYDPERGTAFSSYAVPAIARSIWRAVVLAQRTPPEEPMPHPPQAAPDLEDPLERVISYELLHGLVAGSASSLAGGDRGSLRAAPHRLLAPVRLPGRGLLRR